MATYKQALKDAEKYLEDADCGEQAALMLLLEISNLESHDLYMEYDSNIDEEIEKQFKDGVERLKQGEPLGHILGFEWFYGYRYIVNEDVLIPRPETEELVGNILIAFDELFEDKEEVSAIDVGTGSGAIAITLKKEEPRFKMRASDISEEAIAVAKQNAINNEADVEFYVGDMLQPFIDQGIKVDVLISNPPYIPNKEQMEHSVVDFEPHVALFGGDDGLYFYRKIFENAHLVLNEGAFMAFEIGYDQRETILAETAKYFPGKRAEVLKDISGNDRMLLVYM